MPGRERNLEIKAVDPDPHATLEAALGFGAEDQGFLHQRDTYFHAVTGRLKLREAPPRPAELIAYARADRTGPKVSGQRGQAFVSSAFQLLSENDRDESPQRALRPHRRSAPAIHPLGCRSP